MRLFEVLLSLTSRLLSLAGLVNRRSFRVSDWFSELRTLEVATLLPDSSLLLAFLFELLIARLSLDRVALRVWLSSILLSLNCLVDPSPLTLSDFLLFTSPALAEPPLVEYLLMPLLRSVYSV